MVEMRPAKDLWLLREAANQWECPNAKKSPQKGRFSICGGRHSNDARCAEFRAPVARLPRELNLFRSQHQSNGISREAAYFDISLRLAVVVRIVFMGTWGRSFVLHRQAELGSPTWSVGGRCEVATI